MKIFNSFIRDVSAQIFDLTPKPYSVAGPTAKGDPKETSDIKNPDAASASESQAFADQLKALQEGKPV